MTPDEEWRAVVGYEGSYEVSDQGRVRSVDRWRKATGKPYIRRGVLLKPNLAGAYPIYMLRTPGRSIKRRAHVIVAAAFLGPRPAGHDVCHNNGDRMDNRAANLRYDTRTGNSLDMLKHGTHPSSSQTHCLNGHPLEGNRTPSGCRACHRERSKRLRDERRIAEGRVARADRTECKYGHPLDGKNATQRFCKTCRKAASDRYIAKRHPARAKE